MKRIAHVCTVLLVVGLATSAYGAPVLKIITPIGAGGCYGSSYFPMEWAFDAQPTWDAGSGQPLGGGGGSNAPSYAGARWGYMDFGPDFADIRIVEGWTQYPTNTNGDAVPYQDADWTDIFPGSWPGSIGNPANIPETTITFNSATGLSTGGAEPWYRDFDVTATPITPPARYLMLQAGITSNRGKEYAFVGYLASEQSDDAIPEPATMGLLAIGGVAALLRRRRRGASQRTQRTRGDAGMKVLTILTAMAVMAAGATAAEVFNQDFSDGGVVADYVTGGGASGSLFDNIAADAGASATIDANSVLLWQDGAVSNSDAGLAKAALTSSPGLMTFQADVTIDRTTTSSTYTNAAGLSFGNRTTSQRYDVYMHGSTIFQNVYFKSQGSNAAGYNIMGTGVYDFAYGTAYAMRIFLNDSDVAQTYLGPDGGTYNLSATPGTGGTYGSYAVWMDDMLVIDDAQARTYVHSGNFNNKDLDSFLVNWTGSQVVSDSIRLDNVVVLDHLPQPEQTADAIPEPATMGLLAIGGIAVLLRRRRR